MQTRNATPRARPVWGKPLASFNIRVFGNYCGHHHRISGLGHPLGRLGIVANLPTGDVVVPKEAATDAPRLRLLHVAEDRI